MKKVIRNLLAASFVFIYNSLLALPPSASPELTIAISSSAVASDVMNYITEKEFKNLCMPNTLNVYRSSSNATDLTSYNAYFCSINLNTLNFSGITPVGNLAAKDINQNGSIDVLFYFRVVGGYASALSGVCDIGNDHLLVDNTCTADGATGYVCSSLASRKSDGSLIDIELNKLPLYNNVCATKKVTQTSVVGEIYNTPISVNFRNALQCAQGLVVGAEDEVNTPSLPKGIVASVFNGGIANWNKLQAQKADGSYAALPVAVADRIANGLCPGYNTQFFPIPSDTRVRACRPTSGIASTNQFRIHFLNAICSLEAQDMLADNTPNSPTTSASPIAYQNITPNIPTAPAIIEAPDASMRTCLFNDSNWVIGIMATEYDMTALSFKYRYIKIDGYAPTVKNVLQNHYFDWVESQWIWLDVENANQDQKDKVDFQKVLLNQVGRSVPIRTSRFGNTGYVKVNTIPGNTPSFPIDLANPVATSSHVNGAGGVADLCRTPTIKVNTSF